MEEKTPKTRSELKLLESRTRLEIAECEKRLLMQEFRPCRLNYVILYHDGIRWVCSYRVVGDDFSRQQLPEAAMGQSGVEAYGSCPEEACQNFDAMWLGVNLNTSDEDEEPEGDEWLE